MQIIGKGGFAREVSAYLQCLGVKSEMYTHDECPEHGKKIIAIGSVEARKYVSEWFGQVLFECLDFGPTFSQRITSEGTIICPGAIITTNVTVGRHVIVNLNATIGHDCQIGDFVTISPGAHLSGNVKVGNLCYIGTGAVIREKITICDGVTIGAGSAVVNDITEPGTYVGVPAKKIDK